MAGDGGGGLPAGSADPIDAVTADEWQSIFHGAEFRRRLRDVALLPATQAVAGLFLVFRGVGSGLLRHSRVYEHDPAAGRSATEELYEDMPELYSDPILFLMEVHSADPSEHGSRAYQPSQNDLRGLLTFVSAKGFTQMPLGVWVWPEHDALTLFIVQWRGYPSLDEWEAVEAVFEDAGQPLPAIAAALDATAIVRTHIARADADTGLIDDLGFCARFAYDLRTYGEPGAGYQPGPVR